MCSLYAIVRYKYLNRVTRRAVIFHETKRHLAQEEDAHGRSLEKGKCFIFSYSFFPLVGRSRPRNENICRCHPQFSVLVTETHKNTRGGSSFFFCQSGYCIQREMDVSAVTSN
jgi:hypothetical protein